MKTQVGEAITGNLQENTIEFEITDQEKMTIYPGESVIIPMPEFERLAAKVRDTDGLDHSLVKLIEDLTFFNPE